jgi:hypothetical protein
MDGFWLARYEPNPPRSMPDFDIETVRVLMRMNQGRFVAPDNEDIGVDYMPVLIKQICPVIHLRVSPQTASNLAAFVCAYWCVSSGRESSIGENETALCGPGPWLRGRKNRPLSRGHLRDQPTLQWPVGAYHLHQRLPPPRENGAAINFSMSNVMERTVIDWVEELRGLDPLEAAETILSGLGKTRQHDVKTLAHVLTAWTMLAKEEEKRL